MNPYDSVGTSRLSMALYDRTCRIAVGYQDAEHERQIVQLSAARAKPALIAEAVELTRATREHPDLRFGASVRGASTTPGWFPNSPRSAPSRPVTGRPGWTRR
jgi:MoxR-like ATPases